MFDGWMSFAGQEIINTTRTYTYAKANGITWLQDCGICPDLAAMLGDEPYKNPWLDETEWFDPDNPDTFNFYGLYPLDITGRDDSTRVATVTEAITDGGHVGAIRHNTRTMVVTGMMVALNDRALDMGLNWLRYALLGNVCQSVFGCSGEDVCYLATCPPVCDDHENYPEHCLDEYQRVRRRVTCTSGPRVVERFDFSVGAGCTVEFTLVAAMPWSYGLPVPIIDGIPANLNPILVPDDTAACAETPMDVASCVADPWCEVPLPPPGPPSIQVSCFSTPPEWLRYVLKVPSVTVPAWADAVPIMSVTAGENAVRQVRIRFYADPLDVFTATDLPPCAHCGEFYISYIGPNSKIVIDGTSGQIEMQCPGDVRSNASGLVSSSDGGPFVWPLLTCGTSYAVVFDVATSSPRPVDVSLSVATKGI